MLAPRPYQEHVANIAKHENVIVKLFTGSGKTLIACLVIQDLLPLARKPLKEGGKRIIFVAKTVHLVYQHARTLRDHFNLLNDKVTVLHGSHSPVISIDPWAESCWIQLLERSEIIVITGGLFLQVLNHCKIPLNYISQIIMDECHHSSPETDSDFRDICAILADNFPEPSFKHDYSNGPKMLGLTASVVNNISSEADVPTEAYALEKIMRSRLITSDHPSILEQAGILEEKVIRYQSCSISGPYFKMYNTIKCGIDYLERHFGSNNDVLDLEQFLDEGEVNEMLIIEYLKTVEFKTHTVKLALITLNTIQEEFGPLMAYLALKFFVSDFDKKLIKFHVATSDKNQVIKAIVYALGQMKEAMNNFEESHNEITSQLSWKPPGYVSSFLEKLEPIEMNVTERIVSRQAPVLPDLTDQEKRAWGTWLKAEFPYSDKMEKLLFVLGNSKKRIENQGEDFCALVLTKSRMMSLLLAEFLNLLAKSPAPNYGKLKAKHCISANSKGKTVQMSQSEQTVVLSEFKDNHFNVMVATNVLEEGLDVRRCNVVCKTNPVTEFRSYVQSKGRARSKNSYYYVLCTKEEASGSEGDLRNFQRINRSLDKFMLDKMRSNNVTVPSCTLGEYSVGCYLPYGLKGPRISPSSSGSILMSYLGTLRIESSYNLKPMYSFHKDWHSCSAKMLLPPPSPLSTIIEGPRCTSKQQAKQAVRVKACKMLHEMGRLNDQLLPCNLSPLVEMNKEHYTCSQERSQINDSIARAIEHMRVESGKFVSSRNNKKPLKKTKPVPPHLQPRPGPNNKKWDKQKTNEVTKKKKLPTSATYQPRYIPPSMRWNVKEPELPPGLNVAAKSENKNVEPPVNKERQNEPVRMETEEATTSCELDSESLNYYTFKPVACLSSPYQKELEQGLCYIYSWKPAKSEVLANLLNVPENVFADIETCIGLVLSRPISLGETVCRVPVYLQSGMLRVLVKLEAETQISNTQIAIVKDAHKILATLSTHYNRLEMFGPNLFRHWTNEPFRGLNELVHGPAELKFAPSEARINGLFAILRNNQIDFDATESLLAWSKNVEESLRRQDKPRPMIRKDLIAISSVPGIITKSDLVLAQLPQEKWLGRVVRPMHLNLIRDTGSYVITGSSRNTAASQVDKEMMKSDEKISYHEYFKNKYPMYEKSLLEDDEVWRKYANLPLAQVTRLTSGSNSCANYLKGAQEPKQICLEEQLSYSLVVHPLPAWLWTLLSLTPYILHQMSRCLLNLELCNGLKSLLYDGTPQEDFAPALSSKCVFMPDRLNGLSVLPADRQMYEQCVAVDPVYGDWEQSEDFLLAGFNDQQLVPTASQLFCPMTTESARDFSNLERMEWLGDAFLKFVATVVTFSECVATADEGCLTARRMEYISNAYLHKMAQELKLPLFFTGYEFKPSINYLPPGYTALNLELALNKGDPRFVQSLKLKTVADSVESMIGTILCTVGIPASLRFMNNLGIVPWGQEQLPSSGTDEERIQVARSSAKFCDPIKWRQLMFDDKNLKSIDPEDRDNLSTLCVKMMQNLEITKAQKNKGFLKNDQLLTPQEAQTLVSTQRTLLTKKYAPLMELLGYEFRKIEYLHQALTHPTADPLTSGVFGCYQRLEFLGDGVLDRAIAFRIFAENKTLDPGKLTDLKIALVENVHLSCLMCKFKLYGWINHNIEGMNDKINEFASYRLSVQHNMKVDAKTKELHVKILADVFEALVGAVFLDCDSNEQVMSSFVNRFFNDSIKAFMQEIPITPLHYNDDGSTTFKVETPRGVFNTTGKDRQAVLDRLAAQILKEKN